MSEKTGAKRIAAERQRQISKEGWTAEHDAEHVGGELSLAAICYAAPRPVYVRNEAGSGPPFVDPWPEGWSDEWDKRPREGDELVEPTPAERIRMLEKAGALIAAEIDRLLRIARGGSHGG